MVAALPPTSRHRLALTGECLRVDALGRVQVCAGGVEGERSELKPVGLSIEAVWLGVVKRSLEVREQSGGGEALLERERHAELL